jgi:hypothetical protein
LKGRKGAVLKQIKNHISCFGPWVVFVLLLLCLGLSALGKKEKLKPEELVRLHLETIGTEGRTNCVADGQGVLRILRGGGGVLTGPSKFLSEGRKLRMSILFNRSDYPAEEVSFDGDEVDVSQMSPGRRSPLGEFLYQYDEIVTEGLFGGVLSTGWPLLEVEERKPKLKYEGLKKVDEVEYHSLRYRPRKRSDLDIRLYFDPKDYRHLLTVYKIRIEPFGGRTMDERALQAVIRYDVREFFSEFKEIEGLTLPSQWTVDYTREVGTNIDMLRWTMDFNKIQNNGEINPVFFRLH